MTTTRRSPRIGEPGYNLAALVHSNGERTTPDAREPDSTRGNSALAPSQPASNGDGAYPNGNGESNVKRLPSNDTPVISSVR